MHSFTPCVAFLVLLRIMAATKYVFFSDCFSHVSFLCGCTVVVPWSIKQLQLYNDNCSILLSYAFLQPSSSLYLPLLLFCFAPSLIPLSPFLFSLPSLSVLILYPPLSLPLFLSSLSSSSSSPPSSSDPNAYSMSKVNLSVGHDPSLRMQNLQLLVVRVKHFYLTYLQQLVISTLPNVSAICHSPDSGKLVGSYPSSFSFPV